MLTPRTTLARRVTAALDASPSRIPVLLGGCGTGRTTLLRQLRERLGRTSVQHIDVERIATTPERFLRAITSVSPFPVTQAGDAAAAPGGARAAFDTALGFFGRARTAASEPATFFLDEFLELRTFESFPGLRRASSPQRCDSQRLRALSARGLCRQSDEGGPGLPGARPGLLRRPVGLTQVGHAGTKGVLT